MKRFSLVTLLLLVAGPAVADDAVANCVDDNGTAIKLERTNGATFITVGSAPKTPIAVDHINDDFVMFELKSAKELLAIGLPREGGPTLIMVQDGKTGKIIQQRGANCTVKGF